jgi:hypothetical protein
LLEQVFVNWVAIIHQFNNLSKMRFKYFF